MKLDNPQIEAIWERLVRFSVARGLAREDGEDLVQDILLRTWRRAIDFETERHLLAYLYCSARNAATSLLRRRGLILDVLDDPASPIPDPAAQLQSKEIEQIVREKLDGVGESPVRAFIDPDIDAPSYAEAAVACGMQVGALRTAVSRRRKALRAELHKVLAA